MILCASARPGTNARSWMRASMPQAASCMPAHRLVRPLKGMRGMKQGRGAGMKGTTKRKRRVVCSLAFFNPCSQQCCHTRQPPPAQADQRGNHTQRGGCRTCFPNLCVWRMHGGWKEPGGGGISPPDRRIRSHSPSRLRRPDARPVHCSQTN